MDKVKKFPIIAILLIILLVVVTVLLIVLLIPKLRKDEKQITFQEQISKIEKFTSTYIKEKEDLNIAIGSSITVTLKQLRDEKYLSNTQNPYTNKPFLDDSIVIVTKKSNKTYDYHYEERDNCKYNKKECLKDVISNNLKGKSQKYQDGNYYKGTNVQIRNNYVWYSGWLYRVMGINSDGSIKLISSLPVVSISFGNKSDYANSYARKWLNILPDNHSLKDEYEGIFYKSLNRPDFIGYYAFCVGKQDPTSNTDTTCDNKLTEKVGLLSWWEYKIASSNSDGLDSYLDINDRMLFMTGDSRDNNNILVTDYTGSLFIASDSKTYLSQPLDSGYTVAGVRPVINLKATISIDGGNGSSSYPYRLAGDTKGIENDLLTSRYAGEYLNVDKELYRIVSKDINGNIKIVSDKRIKSTGTSKGREYTYFDKGIDASNLCNEKWPYNNCSNVFNPTDGSDNYDGDSGHNIAYFLNNEQDSNSYYNSLKGYKSYLMSGTYYLGKWGIGSDYKKSYTNATSNGYGTLQLNVGMLQYGEMLAGNNLNSLTNTYNYWLLNPYDSSIDASYISVSGNVTNALPIQSNIGVRPVLTLKSSIKIKDGDGTRLNPYIITD